MGGRTVPGYQNSPTCEVEGFGPPLSKLIPAPTRHHGSPRPMKLTPDNLLFIRNRQKLARPSDTGPPVVRFRPPHVCSHRAEVTQGVGAQVMRSAFSADFHKIQIPAYIHFPEFSRILFPSPADRIIPPPPGKGPAEGSHLLLSETSAVCLRLFFPPIPLTNLYV